MKLCDFGLARSYSGLKTSPNKYFEEVKKEIDSTNMKRIQDGMDQMDINEAKKIV